MFMQEMQHLTNHIHATMLRHVLFVFLQLIIRYDTIEEINVDSKAEYTA